MVGGMCAGLRYDQNKNINMFHFYLFVLRHWGAVSGMADMGELLVAVINFDDFVTKCRPDNVVGCWRHRVEFVFAYGLAHSHPDGIVRATNVMAAACALGVRFRALPTRASSSSLSSTSMTASPSPGPTTSSDVGTRPACLRCHQRR